MNTGLQDIWNLVWKLDLTVRGHGSEVLLDSYTAERRPVIKQVIAMTDLLTKAMGTPSKLAQALRDTIIPLFSHLTPLQHRFVQALSELGIGYGGSPIIEGAGERYFDDSIRGGKGIGGRFLFLLGDSTDSATREGAEKLCQSFRDIVEVRTARLPGMTLVRPDGYVAYNNQSRNATLALEAVRSLLQRQTN